ncbi:hypothetical protein ACFV30_31320 [Streptomyces sp. NPDC059752]|uniref:hypothetical protein n=1 Tax=unclassified Streptomyces TaxID=2593676 RepID=UPI0036560220
MRLNGTGAPAGPFAPGGSGTFGSTPAEKNAAANTIENELEDRTKTATEHADESTNTAVKGFDGWDTAAGLTATQHNTRTVSACTAGDLYVTISYDDTYRNLLLDADSTSHEQARTALFKEFFDTVAKDRGCRTN